MRFLSWWLGLVAHLVLVMWHGAMPAPALALLWVSLAVWILGGMASVVASLILRFKPRATPASPEKTFSSPLNKEV